jgi:methenyltetrahydrofolate cyclohydrolase
VSEPALPAASATAAATVSSAAALVVRVARSSLAWADAPGVAAQAQRLRVRAGELVVEAEHAYAAALIALAGSPGDGTLMVRLQEAAAAPLEVGRLAADVALLAAVAAEGAEAAVRPDAVAAAALAAGAAAAVEPLVAVNLGVTAQDERRAQAAAHRRAAARAAAGAEAAAAGGG